MPYTATEMTSIKALAETYVAELPPALIQRLTKNPKEMQTFLGAWIESNCPKEITGRNTLLHAAEGKETGFTLRKPVNEISVEAKELIGTIIDTALSVKL